MASHLPFLQRVAEILEVDPECLSLETEFRSATPDWDSLRGFAMLVMLEDELGLVLTEDEFLTKHTLGDLYREASDRDLDV